MSSPGSDQQSARRSRVIAWALWDTGATGVNAIVVTFVFSVYLTQQVGEGLPSETTPAGWLGWALAGAGLVVALLAPATGIWVDAVHRRRAVLTALTCVVVVLTAAMSLVPPDYHYLWLGLILLAGTAACNDLATVPYNAMLRQLSTPASSGRISGLGLAAGYFGSVLLLVLVYLGFIAGTGEDRGLLGLSAADGYPARAAVLLAAVWFALFAFPLLAGGRTAAPIDRRPRVGIFGAYRALRTEVLGEWRRDRNVVYYLLASAVFRDGLTGVFSFGAVLGVTVYGVSQADVLLFGVCACVVAAVGSVIGGLLDDKVGSKRIIVSSLIAMLAVGIALLSSSGSVAFWICGLLLCLFIGPTQASARTLMLRLSADDKEGVAFGLYTTTGRAVSFLAPWLFALFISVFGTTRAGLGGILLVLLAGLVAMVAVRVPHHSQARP